jgi:tetratricopeptide (TPR) repeat protein
MQGQDKLSPKKQAQFDKFFFEAQSFKVIQDNEEALKNFESCLKLDPKNAVVNFELAGLYFIESQPSEAKEKAKIAIEQDPKNEWYRLRYIEILTVTGQKSELIGQWEMLVEQFPNRLGFKLQLAQAYLQDLQYQNCIDVLTDAERLEGITLDKSVEKRDLYLSLKNTDNARKEVEKLSNAHPSNIEYLGVLAAFYAEHGPQDKTESTYLKIIELAPEDPRAHLNLASYYRSKNQNEKSVYHLKLALVSPNLDIDPKVRVLMSFYELGNSDSTMNQLTYELLDSIEVAHPKNPKAYALKADFLVRDGQRKLAQENLKKAIDLGATQRQILEQLIVLDLELSDYISLEPHSELAIELYPNQPFGYLMNGIAWNNLEQYENATEILETGQIYVVNNPRLKEQFYLVLADAYHNLEDHFNSDSYFEKAIKLNENNPTALNNFAYYLALRKEKLSRALELTEKCNSLSPNNPVFLDTWAWVLYQKGDYNDALVKIDAALNGMSNPSGDVLEHKGDILFKLKRTAEAVASWNNAKAAGQASKLIDKKIKDQKLYE